MFWLDIVLIVWLTASLISGVRAGFVYKLGTFVGFIVGIWAASIWTPQFAPTFGDGQWTTAIVFLVILSIVSKLFGVLAWLIDKVFKLLSIIPFLKTFNRVLGGLLSVVITIFVISAVSFVANAFSHNGTVSTTVNQSVVASSVMPLSVLYAPLIADSLDSYVGGFSDEAVIEGEAVVEDVIEEGVPDVVPDEVIPDTVVPDVVDVLAEPLSI